MLLYSTICLRDIKDNYFTRSKMKRRKSFSSSQLLFNLSLAEEFRTRTFSIFRLKDEAAII